MKKRVTMFFELGIESLVLNILDDVTPRKRDPSRVAFSFTWQTAVEVVTRPILDDRLRPAAAPHHSSGIGSANKQFLSHSQ